MKNSKSDHWDDVLKGTTEVPAIRLPRLYRLECLKTRVCVDNSTKLLNLPRLPPLEAPVARDSVNNKISFYWILFLEQAVEKLVELLALAGYKFYDFAFWIYDHFGWVAAYSV